MTYNCYGLIMGNFTIDLQIHRTWELKEDLGDLLVKPSFYTDYKAEAWREETACQGRRE